MGVQTKFWNIRNENREGTQFRINDKRTTWPYYNYTFNFCFVKTEHFYKMWRISLSHVPSFWYGILYSYTGRNSKSYRRIHALHFLHVLLSLLKQNEPVKVNFIIRARYQNINRKSELNWIVYVYVYVCIPSLSLDSTLYSSQSSWPWLNKCDNIKIVFLKEVLWVYFFTYLKKKMS